MKKEKGLAKINNNQIIFNKLENEDLLYEMTETEIQELAEFISDNVNLKALERAITKATLNLSGVGGPSFMADARWLAMDNQKRLELIYMLTNNFQLFKGSLTNYRRNRLNFQDNSEGLLHFILTLRDLFKTTIDFQDFKLEEHKENMKQLEESKRIADQIKLEQKQRKLLNQ